MESSRAEDDLRPTDESETDMTSPTPGAEPDSASGDEPDSASTAPVAPKTAPARSALIAGAAGLAVVAAALGFGAGYITGDTTSDQRGPAAVWQQGGTGPGMGGGPQMGGPQTGGPQMGRPDTGA